MKRIFFTICLLLLTTYFFGQNVPGQNHDPDSSRVIVAIIVEMDGSISRVSVDKVECNGCSKTFKKNIKKEALRVVREMPKFKEHKQRTRYLLPIKFKLEDSSR
jgi:hypothetical protein